MTPWPTDHWASSQVLPHPLPQPSVPSPIFPSHSLCPAPASASPQPQFSSCPLSKGAFSQPNRLVSSFSPPAIAHLAPEGSSRHQRGFCLSPAHSAPSFLITPGTAPQTLSPVVQAPCGLTPANNIRFRVQGSLLAHSFVLPFNMR